MMLRSGADPRGTDVRNVPPTVAAPLLTVFVVEVSGTPQTSGPAVDPAAYQVLRAGLTNVQARVAAEQSTDGARAS